MNKEQIKAKMLKSASQIWGAQSSDIAAFDPIVNILLGACAVELEKVYNEISSSNARVLERLSKLLLPDVNKNTQPAHGIIHAKPYSGNTILNRYSQFFFSKKVSAKESSVRENLIDVYLSPVVNTAVVSGTVKFLGTNSGLYEIEKTLWKEKFAKVSSNKINTKMLWLGIQVDKSEQELKNLSFYFDWIGSPFREKYLDYIPFTKWYHNKQELDYTIGINQITDNSHIESNFNYDSEFIVTQNILSYYKKRFVNIDISENLTKNSKNTEKYPEEFSLLYNEQDLQKINEEYLWIKVIFPPFITDEIIEQLICQINCVPVMNRKLNETIFRLHDADTFNIIPLKDKNDDASFFSMESVKSSEGRPYVSSKISDLNELSHGNYVIRKGGVQRFDQRNAKEYLSYMVDLLRDESASFSVYGQEMLSSKLKELSESLAVIEQKIQRSTNDEHSIDYLILRSLQNQDNVHVEYWSTMGDFANNIRVGSDLSIYDAGDISSDNLIIVSEMQGGRDELTAAEMLTSFKQSLASRDRVVTISDIRNVCFSEMGNLIKDVQVTKEFIIDSGSKTGFKRVIKVKIITANFSVLEEKDMTIHKLRLESIIKNSSFANTPVEITITN